MSATNRLQAMQSALKERGVRDVKFCFAPNLGARPSSTVASDVADVLDAYLNKRYKPVDRIGDSALKK